MQCGVSATDWVGQAWSLLTTRLSTVISFSTVWVPTMMGVGQALSVPTVDPSRYQTLLMGAVGTRKGMSGTLSLVIWVIHICCLASGPGGEKFQWNLPYYFHITHFYHLCSKYDNLPTSTQHVYLRVGDIERAWLTRSVAPNTLILFDFYTFLADTRSTIHTGAILLGSVLYVEWKEARYPQCEW